MRTVVVLAAVSLLGAQQSQQDRLPKVLERVAEEAEAFFSAAPKVLGEETLRQKVIKRSRRFRPRIGSQAVPPPPKYSMREIVSEYGYSTFEESPNALHEFREVTTVDGREVKDKERARLTLTMGVTSRDDRLKKRMLKDFEKHGLVGAATDFGQVILLFGKRRLGDYAFQFAGKGRIGEDEALAFSFRQNEGQEGVTIFEGRKVIRRPLVGQLWVRESDFLPLRIELAVMRDQGDNVAVDEATIDYAMSKHGVLLPTSVVHRERVAGQVVVENAFEYSSFRMFTAETEIKFRGIPTETPNR